MIRALFGPSSPTYKLRQALDQSMGVHREIARKVADSFSSSSKISSTEGATTDSGQDDLVNDMAALADTQLRYEIEAKLLRGAYDKLRRAIRGNA